MISVICPSEKCTGCSACMNVCPVDAITMQVGKIGHIYPQVSDKCIECNKCIRTCPVNNNVKQLKPLKTYAAWALDKNEHSTSTSGGASAIFANKILSENGVVYGCASLPQGKIEIVRIDKQSEVHIIKGSKYVHSHVNYAFRNIKNDLKAEKKVIFIGLPCQVAGLKKYIGENCNLITVDLICHGVPSQKILHEYLTAIGIDIESVEQIKFRESKGYYLSVYQRERLVYRKPEHKDLYYMAFNDNLCFRDSCFQCNYSKESRVGDLTIGDFWGLGSKLPFNHKSSGYVSVILVNNDKGSDLLNSCKNDMFLEERTLEEAIDGNHNLRQPSVASNAKLFQEKYGIEPLISLFKRCEKKRRFKAPFLPIVQFILKYI